MEQWRNELYHFGVKGMKWGIRRYSQRGGGRSGRFYGGGNLAKAGVVVGAVGAGAYGLSRLSKKRKERSKKLDVRRDKKARNERKKAIRNVRTLSDKEIDGRISRIQKEKELRRLTNEDLHPGRSAVTGILSTSGRKVATTVLTGAGLYAIKAALTRRVDPVDMAGYVAPKPKNKG